MLGGAFVIYEMNLKLNEQEYAKLVAAAAKNGKQPEAFLRDIVEKLESPSHIKRPMTASEFEEKLYREGKILNIATRRPWTPEELAERERLAQLFAGGKTASEMVIEDRGPY